MSFLFHLLSGGNMKKKNDSMNAKPRSLRMEPLETREMLSVGALGTDQFVLAAPPMANASMFIASATPQSLEIQAKLELSGTRDETTKADTLTWTALGEGYTYRLMCNGNEVYSGEDSLFVCNVSDLNRVYFVYAEKGGQTTISDRLQLGPMYNPTLTIDTTTGKTKLSWDDQKLYDSNSTFSYMLTRNGVTITPMLSGTSFIDTGAPTGNSTYVLFILNQTTKKWTNSEAVLVGKLANPTGVSVTGLKKDGFTLNWTKPTDMTGLEKYSISLYQGSRLIHTVVYTKAELESGKIAHTFEELGLTPNTTYQYRIQAISNVAYTASSDVVSGNVTTASLLPAPTGLTATSVTQNTISLSWTAPADSRVTGYTVEWSTDGQTWLAENSKPSTGTTATISGLSAFTPYFIRVSATGGNDSSNYVTMTQYTQLATPTDFKVSGRRDTQITLSWTPPANVPSGTGAGYKIEWSTNGTTWNAADVQYEGPNATSTTVTKLSAGTDYFFRLTAVVTSDPKVASASTSTSGKTASAMLAPPSSLTATAGVDGNTVTLTWPNDTTTLTTGYLVERLVNGAWETVATPAKGTQSTQSLTFNNLLPGNYRYRISSTGTNTEPNGLTESNDVTVYTGRPNITGATVSATGLTLNWTAPGISNGISGYVIEYAKPGQTTPSTVVVNDPNVLSYEFGKPGNATLEANTAYTFRVYAIDADGKRMSEISTDFTASKTWLAKPVFNTPTMGSKTAALSWSSVDGATEYVVEYILKNGNWNDSIKVTVSGTSHTFTGLFSSQDYDFRVQALTKVGSTITNQSDYGTVSEKTLVLTLDKPTGVTVTKQTTNSISLTWDAVDGATSYEYCIDDDDTWKPVPAGSGVPANSCTIKKLAAGTAYTFQIKAVAGSIKSPESDSCTTATLPEKVELLTATVNGSDSATLSWNWSGTSTITGFNIQYREVGTTSWLPCATPDESLRSLTLPSGTLSANTKYEFQIQAIGVAASEFTGSNEILTQLVGPTVLKWDADSQKLTWNQPSDFATSGMNHYVLEWMPASYSADVWSQASSMTLDKGDTEKVMTELQPGVKYQFRLRAVILDGNNKIVNDSVADICTAEKEIDLIPLQKPEVAISNVQDHQFTVSWAAVDHAQSYGIFWGYVGTTEGEAQSGMNHNPIIVTGTSYTIDFLYDPADEDPEGTLPAGSAYVVWVYAYAAPDSGYVDSKGTQVTTPTKLEAPVLAPITGVTTSSVTLQWSVGDQTGAKYYQIQYDDGTGWKTFNKDFYPTWNGQFVHDFVAKGNTSYSFRIVAVPTTGSDRVTSNTESAKTKLGVSAELTATMKDTKTVKLDWNSVDGAKGYYVEWIYNTQNWTDAGIVTHREYVSTGTTYTYNTLASGTTYKFRVQAAGTISKAPGYAVAGPVTTQVAAPTNLQIVSVGDRSVKLTWTPGSLTGVSSYTIQYKEVGSPEEMSDLVTGYDSSKSFYEVVNKLNANKTYEFQIKAVGTVFGTDSEWAEKSMTEATKLSKPYNLSEVVAQTTWNSLTLSWSDDANPTGTTYEVQYLVNGVWTTVPNASITFNDKTATITGLEPGQAYSFQVRAVSKTGTTYNNTSEWSTALENMQTAKVQLPQATITGVADKGAPVLNATNTAKTVSVTVSWTYSTSSEAAYAKTFTVKDADGKTCGTVNWDSAKTSYSLDIAGLDPDTEYTFTVEVSGDTGKATSATSASQSFTTQTVAPWSLAVTATESNSVSLSWTEQKSQKDVTQYLVQWCIDGVWTTGYGSQLVDSGLEFVKIGGLVAKTNYTFRIAVLDVNRSTTGNEVWSCSDELKDIITLPAMVDVTKVTLTSQPWLKDNGVLSSVRIDWAAVTGATDYHVYWREAGSTEGWESSKGVYVNVAQHYAYVSGLVPSNTYEFCIAAVTGGGESTWTAPLSATMLQAVHDKPVGLEVVSGSVGVTQLTLQWDAPATGTVNALYSTTYGVKYSLNGAALQDYTGTIVVSENSGKLSCELSGLQPGGKYEFVVYAKDSTEATKSADSASTPATWMLTNKPENVKATGHSSSITLTWDAPTVQDSSGIVGYAIMFEHSDGKSYYVTSIYPTLGQTKFEFKADTFTIKVNGTDTPITLKSNTPYTFYIYSFNSVGNPSEFAKAEGKTLLATAKSAVVENGSVTNTAKIKITMSSDQGSGTAFYRVQWRKADSTEILGTQWFPISQLSGNVLDLNGDSYVFSIGTQYAFDVTAWNRDKDENTHSDTLTVTWATKAEKVKAVKLTVIDENTINIRCDLPETKTGIDKYKVDCYIVGQSNVVQTMTLTESEIYNGVNFTVLPLTDYYFVVTSIGLQGIHNSDGVKSDEVTTPFTVTGTQPTGVNAWRSATFTWPAYQGTFTGYKVEYTVDTTINGAPDWTKVKTKPTTLQSTITLTATNGGDGLIAGQPVWVRVSVMNGTTVVKVSEVSKVLNSLTVPAPIISGFANDILSLSAPQVVLGNYVQSYEIWYDTGNGWVKTFSLVTRPNLNKLLEVDLTSLGLVNGNKIQVRSIGYGVATEWSTMFTVQ